MASFFERSSVRHLVATCLLLPLLSTSAVYGQNILPVSSHSAMNQQFNFSINSGSLGQALMVFSRTTGIDLIFNGVLDSNTVVPALSGEFNAGVALNRLLSGTELQWRFAEPNSIILYRQQDRASTDSTILLGPVMVEASAITPENKRDQAYKEAASVAVITQKEIERFRGTSVGDIFQGTTGVLVGENRNSGGLDVNIRGMQGQGRVPVLVDGARQETTVYRGYSGVSSRSYVDPDLIGNIRIDKGPVMSAEGTGATGGLVSMTTLSADDLIKDGSDWGVRMRGVLTGNNSGSTAETGSYAGYYLPRASYRSNCRFAIYCTPEHTMPESFAPDDTMDRPGLLSFKGHAASLAGAKRFEWVELVVAYAEREQGNYYAGKHGPTPYIVEGEPLNMAWYWETPVKMKGASPFRAEERIPNTQFSSRSLLLKSNAFLPADQTLEMSYLRYDSTFGEMMPSQIKGFGQARQWLDSDVLNQAYTVRYRWEPVEYDWADLRINFWHTDAVSQINTPEVMSVDIEDNNHRVDDYQRYGVDISNTSLFRFKQALSLSYGLAFQTEKMDTDTDTTEGLYSGARTGDRDEFSVFAAVQWQPFSQITVDAGIRYTRFKSHDNNPLPISVLSLFCDKDEKGDCLPIYYTNSYSGSAPIASLTWEPYSGIQLYARYAEALRMPSLFESTSGWSVSPTLDIYLKPEHAKNREVGLNILRQNVLQADDKLAFKIAYFRNYTKDYLTRTLPNAWEDRQGFFTMRNIQGARFHGLESSFEYDNGRFFTMLSGTRYNHIEVCNVGSGVRYYCTDWGITNSYINNMIPPNWHASVLAGVRVLEQKLELGLRGTLMGKRNEVPLNNANPGFNGAIQWHSYRLLDLFISYQHSDNLTVDFNIDNLTDRYYLDALSLGMVPAPGRSARISATVHF